MASRWSPVIVVAGVAAAALTCSCGSATDRIRGGEARFDAAEPVGTTDAAPVDAAPVDAGPNAGAVAADAARDAME